MERKKRVVPRYTNNNGVLVKNKKVTYKGKTYKADKNGILTLIEEKTEN